MQRQIPYTITNFKDIATEGFYYVDKTMYLPELEKYRHPVFLRPRRFGKSLFTELLRYYYDLKYAPEFEQIFGKLWIGKNPTPNRNKFFFLRLSFSGMGAWSEGDKNFVERQFNEHIMTSLAGFLSYYSTELNIQSEDIQLFEQSKMAAGNALKKVIEFVRRQNGKMFVAIDEYDSLTNAMALYYKDVSETENEYLNILRKGGFFRAFFEVLKDEANSVIERVYITGILPITIADMNSGYNIAEWLTFDDKLINMLGITESEFDTLLDEIYSEHSIKHERQHVKEVISKYYDGYKFSAESESVYNPSMTMYALQSVVNKGYLPSKLLDSNIRIDYNQISYIFGNNISDRDQRITQIVDKKEMFFSSSLGVSFDMKAYRDGMYISEGLYYSGILTFSNNSYILKIPNIVTYDMAISYFNRIQESTPTSATTDLVMQTYITNGNAQEMVHQFFEHVIRKFPGQFFSNANESFYHGLLFHILFNSLTKDKYEVLPEYNLPQGRADIMSRSLPGAKVMAEFQDLFEFKQVAKKAKEAEFEAKFKEAKEQIKHYTPKGWRGVAVCFRGDKDYKIDVQHF